MRGDLNLRPVQWLRLWRANLTGGKPALQCRRARALQAPLCTVNCKRRDQFVRRCNAARAQYTTACRCAPCKRWQQTPQSRHGGPRPRGSTPSSTTVAQGSGKRFFPASDSTTRKRPVLQYEHCCASRRATRVRNPVAHSSALALGAGIPSAARDRARASPLQAASGPTVLASP